MLTIHFLPLRKCSKREWDSKNRFRVEDVKCNWEKFLLAFWETPVYFPKKMCSNL